MYVLSILLCYLCFILNLQESLKFFKMIIADIYCYLAFSFPDNDFLFSSICRLTRYPGSDILILQIYTSARVPCKAFLLFYWLILCWYTHDFPILNSAIYKAHNKFYIRTGNAGGVSFWWTPFSLSLTKIATYLICLLRKSGEVKVDRCRNHTVRFKI